MLTTPGYQINNKLYESDNSQVYRALRGADNCPVVLKVLKGANPSPERIAWFKREYEVTRNLNLPGVRSCWRHWERMARSLLMSSRRWS
jgi:serine/threonine protein kinase